jgi:hypothetical protein
LCRGRYKLTPSRETTDVQALAEHDIELMSPG